MEAKGTGDRRGLQDQTPPGLWALDQCVSKQKVINSASGLATTCYLLHHQARYFCQRYFKNFLMRLSSVGITTVMPICISLANLHVPFTWPALPPWKVVSSRECECGLLRTGCIKKVMSWVIMRDPWMLRNTALALFEATHAKQGSLKQACNNLRRKQAGEWNKIIS